jgi:hypothetical protein
MLKCKEDGLHMRLTEDMAVCMTGVVVPLREPEAEYRDWDRDWNWDCPSVVRGYDVWESETSIAARRDDASRNTVRAKGTSAAEER